MLCLDAYKICSEVQIAMKIEKPYPHLFQPLVVRGKKFRNRIISSPHNAAPNTIRAGADGYTNFTENAIAYYGSIARGGAAVVTPWAATGSALTLVSPPSLPARPLWWLLPIPSTPMARWPLWS